MKPLAPLSAKTQDVFGQALALHQQGRLDEAERLYKKVLLTKPNHVDALALLGAVALQTGRPERAVELIGKAVRLDPALASGHSNLGYALTQLGRPIEALASYDAAIALQPDLADAHNNRGIALRALGRLDEALAAHDRALDLNPVYAEALTNRIAVLLDLNRPADALAALDQQIAQAPGDPLLHNDRGNLLTLLQQPEAALAAFDKALALDPACLDAHNNRANALCELGRALEAVAACDSALVYAPEDPETRWNKGMILLRLGRFEEGWPLYEARAATGPDFSAHPLWRGEADIAGQTLLIHPEQGFGDLIQFFRYAALVKAMGARVVVLAPPPLKALLASLDPDILVVTEGDVLPPFDRHIPVMSLPLAFETRLETIPSAPAYLRADAAALDRWRPRLPPQTRRRIGFAWRGNPDHRNDHNRSIPLEQLLPLLAADADWVCLQRDVTPQERALLQASGSAIIPGETLADFNDTAAAMTLLDLVITVDTSLAHLAGALGRPVWILLPFNPDWRWLLNRQDSPWYPSARLLRQARFADWSSVMQEARQRLETTGDRAGP